MINIRILPTIHRNSPVIPVALQFRIEQIWKQSNLWDTKWKFLWIGVIKANEKAGFRRREVLEKVLSWVLNMVNMMICCWWNSH